MSGLQVKIIRALSSPYFFIAILVIFFLESAWIALSAAYPMVFDENTHLGIIRLYSHQWSPMMLQQPSHAEFAGALTRDPSYLYHWLMSFPYRTVSNLTNNVMGQIIYLRFINIVMFGVGLLLYRKLLLQTKASAAIVHTVLLFFVLIPVVPLLAAHINYDNMVFPLVGLALLLATSVNQRIAEGELPTTRILLLLTMSMFSSLVKFEFLPIFTAITVWIGWNLIGSARNRSINFKRSLRQGWETASWLHKSLLAIPLIAAAILFGYMYGGNLLMYHSPTPQCDQVLTERECSGYAPWARNQQVLSMHLHPENGMPVYAASWTYRMLVAMFFTSSGGAGPGAWYLSVNPLPITFLISLLLFILGLGLAIIYRQKLSVGYTYIGFLAFVTLFYCAAVLIRNYHDYQILGEKIAIQGRYLFPVVLPGMLILGLAYRQFFNKWERLKLGLVVVVLLLLLQGGGALTYITYSNRNWYWPNSTVIQINEWAQNVVRSVIIVKTPMPSVGGQ